MIFDTALCIECGCDDKNACEGGCSWLRVDREEGLGVCSSCPDSVARWDAGNRALSEVAADDFPDPEGSSLILPDDPEFDATFAALRSER